MISSSAQITVNFTADQTEGCGSVQVYFCDNSTSTEGPIVAWSWDLGGVTASNECQGRIFGSAGNYEICLTVTDSEGNTATLCEQNFITVHPLPQLDFESPSADGCILILLHLIILERLPILQNLSGVLEVRQE